MFENKTVFDKIKSFDVYRKLPKDYLQPTYIGAVCNINKLKNIYSIYNLNYSHVDFIHFRIKGLYKS